MQRICPYAEGPRCCRNEWRIAVFYGDRQALRRWCTERPVRPSAATTAAAASESPVSFRFAARAHTHQMKSVQWLQKVGCLKKRAMNLWFFTSCTFFWRRAPWRAKPRALSDTSPSLLGSAILTRKRSERYEG